MTDLNLDRLAEDVEFACANWGNDQDVAFPLGEIRALVARVRALEAVALDAAAFIDTVAVRASRQMGREYVSGFTRDSRGAADALRSALAVVDGGGRDE